MTLAIQEIVDEIDEINFMEKFQELSEESTDNNPDWSWDYGTTDEVVDALEDLLDTADFWVIPHVTDYGFYWCGCLTLEPWYELEASEEWILNEIVKNHIKIGVDGVMRFHNNIKSPLYRFFLKHRDGYGGNIPASVNSMLYWLSKWMMKQVEKDMENESGKFGKWIPCVYCENCECGYYTDDWKCPECGQEFKFD